MRLPAALASLGATFLAVGCSTTGTAVVEQRVFPVASGYYQGGPATTSEILDIGLPDLQNISARQVRLTAISLVAPSKAVHLHSITAFRLGASGHVALTTGDMRTCKGASSVTAVVTGPHASSGWIVLIGVTFSEPGRVRIGRVKISYVTDGHHGWQYQNLNTVMTVTTGRGHLKRECP